MPLSEWGARFPPLFTLVVLGIVVVVLKSEQLIAQPTQLLRLILSLLA